MLSIDKIFTFTPEDYDELGKNKIFINYYLIDFINVCQKIFHHEFFPVVSNFIFYSRTASGITELGCGDEKENCGMELISGDINFEFNNLLHEFGEKEIVFGLENVIPVDEDEPIWLVIDDNLQDGEIRLSYKPDYDDDDDDDDGDVDPVSDDETVREKVKVKIR